MIDRSAIMRRAHPIRRRSAAARSLCLRESWRIAKEAEARRLLEAATFAATMGPEAPKRYHRPAEGGMSASLLRLSGAALGALSVLLALLSLAGAQPIPGRPRTEKPLNFRTPPTITATPFQFSPVTVYRDAWGRSIGTATEVGGVTVERRSR